MQASSPMSRERTLVGGMTSKKRENERRVIEATRISYESGGTDLLSPSTAQLLSYPLALTSRRLFQGQSGRFAAALGL